MFDLQKGTTLIEASAGTGKTYTLCRIALQLTLQKRITLDRILAVTFTEAATEELASRIHELYQSCLRQLETGIYKEDLLKELASNDSLEVDSAKDDLRYSLEVFDEAPISTIHGFCRRSLESVALETRIPLDAEISQIENELIEQLQNEYIRQNILESSSALSAAFASQSDFEKRLREIGKQCSIHPEAVLRPTPEPIQLETLDRRFASLPTSISDLLDSKADYLPHLNARSKVLKLLSGQDPTLERIASRSSILPSEFRSLEELSSEKWLKAIKKSGKDLSIPPSINEIDLVLAQTAKAFQSLLFNYKRWLSERLTKAKSQANVVSFNDLLHLLWRALQNDPEQSAANYIGSRYDAALIDEFQDTDRIQLKIARSLFGKGDHYLFYIGDPKQAIYRFRGADIYAYFKAVGEKGLKRIPLDRNFRSTPKLVEAVNHLFSNAASAFVDDRIVFKEAESARHDLAAEGGVAAMTIRQLALEASEIPSGSGDYRRVLAELAANDFARRLNEHPALKAEDVTFLVNNKNEANELSEALLQRGIPSSIRADRSVFKTQEAEDLKQLLFALANPARNSFKRGVYACFKPGFDIAELSDDAFDESAASFFDYFGDWARSWYSANFDVAFNNLMDLLSAAQDDSSISDSERRFTNFRQLAELLSEARDTERLSPRGLFNWLCRKESADVTEREEWQTRISSDEGKPQIITVHKSKGLQFPIVILPFVGLKRIRLQELAQSYHGSDEELVIDYAPEAESVSTQYSRREELAENGRLLYVALTRAEREVLLYLCPEEISRQSKLPAESSFARSLLGPESPVSSDSVARTLQDLASTSKGVIDFKQIPCQTGEFVELTAKEARDEGQPVAARPLRNRRQMPQPDRVVSFSALNKILLHDSDTSLDALQNAEAESDEIENAPIDTLEEEAQTDYATEISIFKLPKGTKTGDLLHLILERFDFSQADTLGRVVRAAFDELRFEGQEFEPILVAQIRALAKAELESRYDTLSLEQLSSHCRVTELEFTYPVHGDIKSSIIATLESSELGVIPKSWVHSLSLSEHGISASMLRGFIDLVFEHNNRFYIVDWKSNYLGPTPESYDQPAVLESMGEHNYFLQYLLYCVALKRYLAWRFPGENFSDRFGGVFYIYVRGITPNKPTGIYYDYPNQALLEKLDQALLDKRGAAP